MQVVIEINENLYTRLFDNGVEFDTDDRYDLERSVRHGKVLPKGHGRLIDADILDEIKEMVTTDIGDYKYAVIMDNIRLIPTIIEADKEVEDADSN